MPHPRAMPAALLLAAAAALALALAAPAAAAQEPTAAAAAAALGKRKWPADSPGFDLFLFVRSYSPTFCMEAHCGTRRPM